MIKVRLSSVGKGVPTETEISDGALLSSEIKRALNGAVPDDKIDIFHALVNGKIIPPELWDQVALKKQDAVLIAPRIQDGDSGSLIRTAALIAITAGTGGWATSTWGAGVGAGLFTAGVSMIASAALFHLFPPPIVGDTRQEESLEKSQMYLISGQSNSVRKLQTVPKVYGRHRVFPNVVGSPYTELEADPDTGALVQYMYAIYDFGLGPMTVENIKIGDSDLAQFSDATIRFVDFNKPLVSEGPWDDALSNTLELYKGDISGDSTAISLDINSTDPNVVEADYTVIRNVAPNTDAIPLDISLTLLSPEGLYAYNSQGAIGERNIEIEIMFSKIGENVWKGFNNLDHVSGFKSVGTKSVDSLSPISIQAPQSNPNDMTLFNNPYMYAFPISKPGEVIYSNGATVHTKEFWNFGFRYGQTNFEAMQIANPLGKIVKVRGATSGVNVKIGAELAWGVITAEAPAVAFGHKIYTVSAPLSRDVVVYSYAVKLINGIYDSVITGESYLNNDRSLTLEANTNGRVYITRKEQSSVFSFFKFTPRENADYKVRIRRITSFSTYTSLVKDKLTWVSLQTSFDRSPVITDKRHVFLELKIRATNQLNGTIGNLSAICTSVLNTFNGTSWVKQPSSNPAWVFTDLLTGEVNKSPISISRLHTDSLLAWANFCAAVPTPPPSRSFSLPRFTCSFVLDYAPTLQTALNQVASAAQASINIIDGKYGVLIDINKTVPVQIFTPRNSSNFSSIRTYTQKPHALKISYIDPSADWEQREAIVYDTGYDFNNSTEFQEATSFACTNPEQAWRFGRYLLFQNRLRQETIRIEVDFENLVCTRGDYVQFTQDVMKAGGTPARVKSVSGNQITIDDALQTIVGTYGFIFRSKEGDIFEDSLTVVNANTFNLAGVEYPEVGDLIIIGLATNLALDCIVKSIEPLDDLRASITLVEKADAIFTAESTDSIPDYLPQISPTYNTEFVPPDEVDNLTIVDSRYECAGDFLNYYVDLDWDVPVGSAYDFFEVWVNPGTGYNLIATTRNSLYSYLVSRADVGKEHFFKVVAVSAAGLKLDLGSIGELSHTVLRKTARPENVESLNIDITGEVLQLFWPQVSDCSCKEYLIRYSPVYTDSWESSVPLLRASKSATLAATQARTGVYLIKAVDVEGNESENATQARTTIPELFNLNVIEETTDFPTLLGTFDRTEKSGDTLILASEVPGDEDTNQYYSEGYYYYDALLDLGDIYTSRIQSKVRAEGYSIGDLMANWTSLADLAAMSQSTFSDWDVETQYRGTEQLNIIADWATLASINPLDEGVQELWTEWKKFIIGDVTARILQFRLKLISKKTSVTPRVFDGTIKTDMPDRIESYSNLSAPSGGLAVAYSPAFKGPTSPAIQVSIDTASSGDYWSFDYRNTEGFYIRFFDKNGNPAARGFDAHIKGYGRKATEVL